MSDFVPRDILPELWDEILKAHWTYLDAEESIIKLENRKKLEDCLKEFLCIVPPGRKFFLEETARVLKNSVLELESFSAQKGITAFESISQYANNLFTKPWRKEFRILNLYSGFYQHEIKSNITDAEILFEAMGYRRLSEDTLILDGPICPDQVSNVSRDAMIAYVELQIMKHIHTGLDAIGIDCSWLEIYRHRENHIGSTSEAVKSLANSFEEKRFSSRQKLLDNYGYIEAQPSADYFATNAQFCPADCQCGNFYKPASSMSRQRPIQRVNGFCCVPEHQTPSLSATNLVYNNMSYAAQQQHYQYSNQQHHHQHHHPGMPTENGGMLLSHMPHSRSLDHYSETQNHLLIPHRHSFDHQQQGCTAHYHNIQQQKRQQQQQQNHYQHLNKAQHNFYESPYDCIDGNSLGGGSSTISYAAVTANAGAGTSAGSAVICNLNPSSTYSHPYNVSGNRIPLPLNISNQLFYDKPQSNNYNDLQEPAYAHIAEQTIYSKLPHNFAKNSPIYNNHAKDSLQRQRSCQPEQLINFDETSIQTQFDPLHHQYRPNYETSNHFNIHKSSLTPLSAIEQQHCGPGKPPATNDETYVYARPTPKDKRKQNTLNSRKYPCNTGDTTDISYDSANDDFVNMASTDSERNHQSSPTQSTKNQDGVGSAETWSNVFQNVEKKGYSKDFGERRDLLVQSLGLDSLDINNDTSGSKNSSTEKRRSMLSGNENKATLQQQQQQVEVKSRTFENAKYLASKNNTKKETVGTFSNLQQKQKTSLDNNTKKLKSAPKQIQSTSNSKPITSINKSQSKSSDNKTSSKTVNNNNNDLNGSSQHKKPSLAAVNTTTKKAPSVTSTQIIITSTNEWSCSFCTFINPNSKRVCEICCHSKDFKTDTTSSSAGGAATMPHNPPTCA